MKRPIYLDHHATTPVAPEVFEAMRPYFCEAFGNPGSRHHAYGWEAAEAVEQAREQVARLIGCGPGELYFTSGATESNNLAIKGSALAQRAQGDHLVTVATEHSSVLGSFQRLGKEGFRVTVLPVKPSGLVDLDRLSEAMIPGTTLVSVMHANNEIGVIQPLRAIADIAHRAGALFHTDAAQSVGKIACDARGIDADLLSLSAHKFYGPKGIGALYVGPRALAAGVQPQMDGGHQERGLRSGTLNTPAIVGLGAACVLARTRWDSDSNRLGHLRDSFQHRLESALPGLEIHGTSAPRLPQNLCLTIEGVDEEELFNALPELAISNGSACHGATRTPSHVIQALGHSERTHHATVRIGLGHATTTAELDRAGSLLIEVIRRLRRR